VQPIGCTPALSDIKAPLQLQYLALYKCYISMPLLFLFVQNRIYRWTQGNAANDSRTQGTIDRAASF